MQLLDWLQLLLLVQWLVPRRIVGERNLDRPGGSIGLELALDLLRRDPDDRVALHGRLAGQGIAAGRASSLMALACLKPLVGWAVDVPLAHDHRTPATSSLPATWELEIDAGCSRRVCDQGSGSDVSDPI